MPHLSVTTPHTVKAYRSFFKLDLNLHLLHQKIFEFSMKSDSVTSSQPIIRLLAALLFICLVFFFCSLLTTAFIQAPTAVLIKAPEADGSKFIDLTYINTPPAVNGTFYTDIHALLISYKVK